MEPIEFIKLTNYLLAVIFFICYAYQIIYLIIPYIKKLRPHGSPSDTATLSSYRPE
jgi:hypothetical protein